MPYFSIEGIPQETLTFFGYERVYVDEEFWVYEDADGHTSVVARDRPYLWIEDINDAIQMGTRAIITSQSAPIKTS